MSSSPAVSSSSDASSAKSAGFLAQVGSVFGRSLFPWVALAIILGTMLWGPWVSLVLAVVWWKIVTRIG